METDNKQLELFAQTKGEGRNKKLSSSVLSSLWRYEKAMLLTISFIITCVVSFSLGVEKGKKATVLKIDSYIEIPQPSRMPEETEEQVSLAGEFKEELSKDRTQDSFSGYTIQVASYKTKKYAQKEAEQLKKKGYSALVLPKGRYIIVCVGNFSDKKAAQVLLPKLKNKYRTSYIRRL
ncbi:MAG: SPOR domain-containing protein [Candidatus Omnitrophica bacterium]|nr:SPOR domain-containing protein [Candidatus Omnitrophota bacterium]